MAALREQFPDAEVIVADDGSSDRTAELAEGAGATVLRLRPRGKGEALSAAERAAPPGALLLVDADLQGDLRPLRGPGLRVARFARRTGGGFGLAKRAGRELIRLRSGLEVAEPLSGQRSLDAAARAAVFPLAPGFGAEVRMTIDAAAVPVVGAEQSGAQVSNVPMWSATTDLSTVDDVDTPSGKLALALLLGGATPGHYGVKAAAAAPLPRVTPVG